MDIHAKHAPTTPEFLRSRFVSLAKTPFWAIRPEAVLSAFTAIKVEGGWEAAKPSVRGPQGNKVAIIPIQGVLTNDGPAWYGSNYSTITSAAEQAANDPEVKRVILAVDSPGGEVMGCPETAAALAALAKIKPVSAIVEGQATSAAYYLASQAHDVTVTPSGEVGSVGVRMMHADVSKMLEDAGVKITEMHSGKYKTEWTPFAAVTDEAKADMQARMDAEYGKFVAAVDAGRGSRASKDIRDQKFGEARVFSADAALGHGLVDKIQTPRDFYRSAVPSAPADESTTHFPIRARIEIERLRHS